MTRKQSKTTVKELKELLASDRDFLRPLVEEIVLQVLKPFPGRRVDALDVRAVTSMMRAVLDLIRNSHSVFRS